MRHVMVKYFLNIEGKELFPQWFDKVADISSQQNGFVSIRSEFDEDTNQVVYLVFENQDKLSEWANTETHDRLALEIEPYFKKPKEVVRWETN